MPLLHAELFPVNNYFLDDISKPTFLVRFNFFLYNCSSENMFKLKESKLFKNTVLKFKNQGSGASTRDIEQSGSNSLLYFMYCLLYLMSRPFNMNGFLFFNVYRNPTWELLWSRLIVLVQTAPFQDLIYNRLN